LEGERHTSARWRPSNKGRKWPNFDSKSEKGKKNKNTQKTRTKSIPGHSNFRPSKSYVKRKFEEPKPLIDIFQENNYITVVAEIAGFNRETLKINVKAQKLTLSAKTKDRRYYKSLNLPKVVIPNAMHTEFKNGVLEIKLRKAETIGTDQNAT
jgi:HSP20 family molecular chaperone IbpA